MARTTQAKLKTAPKKKGTKSSPKKKQPVEPPFFQTKLTNQSLYWLIFGATAIVFTLWLYSLDTKVRDLYDEIDTNTYSMMQLHKANLAVSKSK